jgi:hypothetical protein
VTPEIAALRELAEQVRELVDAQTERARRKLEADTALLEALVAAVLPAWGAAVRMEEKLVHPWGPLAGRRDGSAGWLQMTASGTFYERGGSDALSAEDVARAYDVNELVEEFGMRLSRTRDLLVDDAPTGRIELEFEIEEPQLEIIGFEAEDPQLEAVVA